MKEIKAYVHAHCVARVIDALKKSDVFGCDSEDGSAGRHNLTSYMVKGSLLALDDREKHYSLDLEDEVINEYKLEFLCEDEHVDELVSIIQKAAHTGGRQAGWVYVVNIERVAQIT